MCFVAWVGCRDGDMLKNMVFGNVLREKFGGSGEKGYLCSRFPQGRAPGGGRGIPAGGCGAPGPQARWPGATPGG